ncbi:MAG: AHH domain-containing protein [Angustibacter sp.]
MLVGLVFLATLPSIAVAPARAASAPSSVTLSVTGSPASSDTWASIIATVDQPLDDSGMQVDIQDLDQYSIKSCITGLACYEYAGANSLVDASGNKSASHRYIARLIRTADGALISTSKVVKVDPVPWSVTLSASGNPVRAGQAAILSATANQSLLWRFRLDLIDAETGAYYPFGYLGGCTNNLTCTARADGSPYGLRVFRAVIVNSYTHTLYNKSWYTESSPDKFATSNAVAITSAPAQVNGKPNLALLSSPSALTFEQRATAALGDQACLALGEKVRTNALRSSVADATLVCNAYGLNRALQLIANTAGAAGVLAAIGVLADTADNPAPRNPKPTCDQLNSAGECIDGLGQSTIDPTPAPAAAGAGLPPRKNCLNNPDRRALRDSMPLQNHHVASDKNSYWTQLFKEITDSLGLNLTSGSWNIVKLRHGSSHPVEYHQWVYDNMKKAEAEAQGNRETFKSLFKAWVTDVVVKDSTITRKSYWDCYR